MAGEKPVLAFLGPESSYSHQATEQTFSTKEWDFCPAETIGDVFEAVQSDKAEIGVVPLENSTNGSVIFTFDILADRDNKFPDIHICGEIYFDVHHYLVGRMPGLLDVPKRNGQDSDSVPSGACTPTPDDPLPKAPRSRPLVSLAHIRRIYSHPQAFGQCTSFLSTYLKKAEVFDVSSTSRAAEIVAVGDNTAEGGLGHDIENMDGSWAAISSKLAARVHRLDILAERIEDREDNTTRFFIITKRPPHHNPGGASVVTLPPRKLHTFKDTSASQPPLPPPSLTASFPTKSMVSFTVPHLAPGALADVLDGFRAAGLNLTSINSRPSLMKPFQYIFFVEFEGHRQRDPDGRVQRALERVEAVAQRWRWLGSWDVRSRK